MVRDDRQLKEDIRTILAARSYKKIRQVLENYASDDADEEDCKAILDAVKQRHHGDEARDLAETVGQFQYSISQSWRSAVGVLVKAISAHPDHGGKPQETR